jgi:DNA-binding NtrC family response regulator
MPESIIAVLPFAPDMDVVRSVFSGEGVELQFAGSPEEALRLLVAGSAASVILYDADRGQPWRDALPRFHELRPGLRIVLLSGSSDRRMWLDLFDHGGFDIVVRPFRPVELRAIVRSALNPPKFFCRAA